MGKHGREVRLGRDREFEICRKAGLRCFCFNLLPGRFFYPALFLRIVHEAEDTPLFLCCDEGIGPVDVEACLYRILEQRWPLDKALQEMADNGYALPPRWLLGLKSLDLDQLRQEAAAMPRPDPETTP